jgi:hypothetical protein
MAQRMRFFAPDIAAELAAAEVPGPIATAAAGWGALPGGRRCGTWPGWSTTGPK